MVTLHLRLLHCCLVSLILALNTREVFKKPALFIKHQVICAEQRAPVTTLTCELAEEGSGIMYIKNWLILSYCRYHIHYAAVLYIFFLEISYLCISVFVTFNTSLCGNVTGKIDRPLWRCRRVSWNGWPETILTIATGTLQSQSWKVLFILEFVLSKELFYLYMPKFFKDVEGYLSA